MSEVYRYDLSLPTNAKNFGMRLSENGCWVEHESYAALESKLASLRAERDALRARVEELEVENLALQNVLSSQQRAPSLEKLVADLRRTELASLRASIAALAAGWEKVAAERRAADEKRWARRAEVDVAVYDNCATELRKLAEGNSAAAQEGL